MEGQALGSSIGSGVTRMKKRKRREFGRVNCGASAAITNVCSYLKIFDTKQSFFLHD
jgi:hypothetical protein